MAILNFNYGLTMFVSTYDQNQKMIARIFWTSIWAILRATEYSNKCVKNGELPIELSLEN